MLDYAEELLEAHLPLEADGYCCTTSDLLDVLLGVAVNRGTVESVCADLVGTPDPETIRRYFNEQLVVGDLVPLEQGLNAALAAQIGCIPILLPTVNVPILLPTVNVTVQTPGSKCVLDNGADLPETCRVVGMM